MGRSKIKNVCLLLPLLLSIISCGGSSFDKLEGIGFSYQVGAGKTDIVRLRFTTDEGAPSIQIFDTKGRLKEEAIIAPSWPFRMTAIKNDTIQMTYIVEESDLDMFLRWFKKKKSKYYPTHIGHYSIQYNYKVRNVHFMDQDTVQVDSLYIDKNTQMMSLFLKQKLIAKKPMYLFTVESSEISLYDPSSKSYIYTFADNKNIAEEYLKEVLALY